VSVNLVPETVMPCPSCGVSCQVGVRTGGQLVINCPEHGVIVSTKSPRPAMSVRRMDPEERLWVLETAVRFFLVSPENDDFLVVQSMSLPCNYVQLRHNDTTLWAEVCSRQWNCPYCGDRPLSEETEIHLSELGFAGGGRERNFESHSLPGRPLELARELEHLLLLAYDEPIDFGIAVYPKRRETLQCIIAAFAAVAGHLERQVD
jgi:hypothetical protein